MILTKGDYMVSTTRNKAGITIVSTNACINTYENLVMGAGAAGKAKIIWPGIARKAGDYLLERAESTEIFQVGPYHREYKLISPDYLFFTIRWPTGEEIGFLQVKRRFDQPADIDLLTISVAALRSFHHRNPDMVKHLNFPGIGNGRLQREDVLPIISDILDSDKFIVFER